MLDVLGMIATLHRPGLLVRAARFGVNGYDRVKHLPRLLRLARAPRHGDAILRLLELEAVLEWRRVHRAAGYRHGRHVAVLSALLGEARALRAASRPVAP
ncbi:DUF6477 family protein [Rubellimicrobium aerolatum]|uniref:DUF6477 family protein n=1 Tax=Rubellimicrobium aerolatum TaxID=490979 RepID=A0ABW0S871_9RHOB|nr:DUF6477 family protein [Rubellimicrobium aerolatum]MBP1804330.1 hypothetical protein [Rubellimicrobium aerolatum]